jgi:translation initiation factor IF-2
MSIRIHKLAEELGLDNKEMMALLKERKIIAADVKSVSSTVDNINASALRDEFAAKAKAAAPAAPEKTEPAAPAVITPAKVAIPSVKSKQDIDREREAAAAAKAAAAKSPAAAPAPAPLPLPAKPAAPVSAPVPLPPRPVSAPPPVARIPVMPAPAPKPVAPVVHAPAPVVVPPVMVRPAPVATPAPVSAPPMAKTPSAPPALPPRVPTMAPKPPPLPGSTPPALPTTAPAGAAPVITMQGDVKILHLKPPIVVRDFASALGLKPFKLIWELNQLVGFAAMNSTVDEAVAQKVAEKHGFLLEIKHRGDPAAQQQAKDKKEKKPAEDETKFLVPRPPVVCILGHVDHGKTSLLDAIRKANVAAGEAGGITQHIGAYQIEFNDRKITFLDTPGHAAFSKMRARGANVTDIAVLVVAADDGFMPQTDEALKHAQDAKVTLLVAVNKMDVKGANLDQVKAQMQQRNIAPEDWGGETITVPVAAIKNQGIDTLLEMILLQADVLELKANPKAEASGIIIESGNRFRSRPPRHGHRPARHPSRGRRDRLRTALRQGTSDVRRQGREPQGSPARDSGPGDRLVRHSGQRRDLQGR